MALIYEKLAASPAWNETALVITYDEHGGLCACPPPRGTYCLRLLCLLSCPFSHSSYDHVPPPYGVPNPDGIDATGGRSGAAFNFTRLGVRVPTIVISPMVDSDVHHELHSASSMLSTLRQMYPQLRRKPLTAREAWAPPFTDVFKTRSTPRTDLPKTVPFPKGMEDDWQRFRAAQSSREPRNAADRTDPDTDAMQRVMTDLQREVVSVADSLVKDADPAEKAALHTVGDGARFIRRRLQKWLKDNAH